MSPKTPMNDALDALENGVGTVEISSGEGEARIDVADSDRLGVRVREVHLTRGNAFDIAEEATALPERLRALPERVQPVEVAPTLGGAVLRSRPEEMRNREFFQVDLEGTRELRINRYRSSTDGERQKVDWTMTREQLEQLVDELS